MMIYKTQGRFLLQKIQSTNHGQMTLFNRQKDPSSWSLAALITIENSEFVLIVSKGSKISLRSH